MKKRALAMGLLSAAVLAGCGDSTPVTRYVMRVDRTFDRGRQPVGSAELAADSYRPEAPADRWEVSIKGSSVVVTPIGQPSVGVRRLEGKATSSGGGERRFDLGEGTFSGGLFVVRGDEAELTVFGSGVPVAWSERGKLVPR